jgi:hypothetical protein
VVSAHSRPWMPEPSPAAPRPSGGISGDMTGVGVLDACHSDETYAVPPAVCSSSCASMALLDGPHNLNRWVVRLPAILTTP